MHNSRPAALFWAPKCAGNVPPSFAHMTFLTLTTRPLRRATLTNIHRGDGTLAFTQGVKVTPRKEGRPHLPLFLRVVCHI